MHTKDLQTAQSVCGVCALQSSSIIAVALNYVQIDAQMQ